jgi:hypothetical protein
MQKLSTVDLAFFLVSFEEKINLLFYCSRVERAMVM